MPSQNSNGRRREQDTPRQYAYVPKSLNAADVLRGLPPRFQAETQAVWFLVSLVHRGMTDRGGDPVPLHAKYLRENLGRKSARDILEACLDHGVLVTDGKYTRGQKSRKFTLGNQFKNAEFSYRQLTDPALLARLAKSQEKAANEKKKNWESCHYRLENWQESSLGIDKPMADEILRNTPAKKDHYRSQSRLIDDIDQQVFRMSMDDRGRVYGNATNVRKDIRPALLLNGYRVTGLDIVNSQPLLLALLMTQRGISGIGDYRDLVCNGVLYDYLGDRCKKGREFAKNRFLVDVLGKRGNYPSELEDVFESAFPAAWEFVQDFNRDDHSALLLELQRVEADLIIRNICMNLPTTHAFFTIHDAVYFENADEEIVRHAFAQNPYGFRIPLAVA